MKKNDFWIGVDLDGTLAEYYGWVGIHHIGAPVKPMIDRVRRWISQGKRVKVFTARASKGAEAVAYIHSWLDRQGLPMLEITNVKDFEMAELWDDRCVPVERNTGRIKNHTDLLNVHCFHP